ncbi:MAG: M12 family metallopeptidase [Beduini sp.]|uniref:M12 family metallopeptidase n=1 Tax=Beduini sp. TaxID=1922300 RepID=UPI0039A1DAFA
MEQEICEGKLIENKKYVLNGEIYEGSFIDHDGIAIVQGDIKLGKIEDVLQFSDFLTAYEKLGSQQKNACLIKKNLWDTKEIPYCIDAGHPKTAEINQAIAVFNAANLNIKYRPKTTTDKDYVRFDLDSGCAADIGKVGGEQTVEIANWAEVGNVLHEMLHVCSIEHEHSRKDRDTFITVEYANFDEKYKDNFELISTSVPYGDYDYESIMHYSAKAFSENGKDTISIKPGHGTHPNMGQRDAMTSKDMDGVKELYK